LIDASTIVNRALCISAQSLALIDINLTSLASESNAAHAHWLSHLVQIAVSIVHAQAFWTHWWVVAQWETVALLDIELGTWRAWHGNEDTNVGADQIRGKVIGVWEQLDFSGTHDFFSAWVHWSGLWNLLYLAI